jgi:dipeptidyl aminopeptidase/acylaminoacyl peptidase
MKMMRAVGIVLVCFGALAGHGQVAGQTSSQTAGPVSGKRPMTFADLMAMKRVSDPQISPSGKWVMFSVTEVSLEKDAKVNHLWVVPIDGSAPERQVTSASGETFGRFSPDGKWVSMTMKEQIYQAPWDEGTGRLGAWGKMTNVAGGADGAIWSPDSKRLMFTASVWPECSVKAGKTTTEILTGGQNNDLKTAEPVRWGEENACDKARDDAAAASPVKAQVWDALLYRHWDQYTGEKRSHILVVDADGKNVRDLTPKSAVGNAETPTWMLGGPLEYAWAPDSKEIAYVTNLDKVPAASTNNDVFTLRLDEPGAKAVKVSTSLGSDDEPTYSPDGKWLAFRSQKQAGFESDRFRLMLYDREKKTIKELLPKFDRWVDEFAWGQDAVSPDPVWRIYFVSGDRGNAPIFRVKTDGSDLEQLNISGEYSEIQVALDGSNLVAGRMSIAEPTKIISIDLDKIFWLTDGPQPSKIPPQFLPTETNAAIRVDHEATLTHLNDTLLAQLDLDDGIDQVESFRFAGAGGMRVQGFILRPPGFDAAKKYPVKFVMHGGPQTALGDSWSYRWNWELMAADGYVVVGINRRGSTGYGQKFVDEVSGDWGGRAYEDLMKGLDYAEAKYPFLDKTRECALGASYGGFMADWVLTHTNRFQCIVTHDGMVDPVSAYGSTEEMWFNEWEFRRPEDFPAGWDGFTGAGKGAGHAAEPWRYQNLPANEDPFRKWSPMRFIENAKTPTLIIHSQRDYRLDVSQGFELYTALERRGVPARFLYFPDEGHWVLKPQNSQLWYDTVSDWCDRWTKSGKYREQGTGNR